MHVESAPSEKKEEIPVNPAEPAEPTTPEVSGTIENSEVNSPQTGDNSNTVIWIAVAVLAASVVTVTFVVTRKRKSE